jgi:hypothetical protein
MAYFKYVLIRKLDLRKKEEEHDAACVIPLLSKLTQHLKAFFNSF